jgi:hypothetical protein
MKRFGEFSLLEELGESDVADCFKANHDAQGGPFFLKRYRHVEPAVAQALYGRCELLMSVSHPNLSQHLGHGDVDGVIFTVSPYVEGVDLDEMIASLRDRRVVLKLETLLYVIREAAIGAHALHAAVTDGRRPLLAHGNLTTRHIRVSKEGQVLLTGLPTPRGLTPQDPPDAAWDCAGLAATIYDLIPLTRPGSQPPPLPPALERVVRRSLGIGPVADQLRPGELAERLEEVADTLSLPPLDRRTMTEIAARTVDAVQRAGKGNAADALPTLEPVLLDAAPSAPPPPAHPSTLEMERVPRDLSGEEVAETQPLHTPPAQLIEQPPVQAPQRAPEPQPPPRPPIGPAPTPPNPAAPAAQPPAPQTPPPQQPQQPPAAQPLAAQPLANLAEPSDPVSGGPRPVTIANLRLPPEVAAALRDQPLEDSAFADAPGDTSAFADAQPKPAATAETFSPFAEGTAEAEADSPFDDKTPGTPPPVAAEEAAGPDGLIARFAVDSVTTAPVADDADPFSEQTLPGHLVESIPSEEPDGEPNNFLDDRTRPDASALVDADAPTNPSLRQPPPSAEPTAPSAPRPGATRPGATKPTRPAAASAAGGLAGLPRGKASSGFSLLTDPVDETRPNATAPAAPKPKSNVAPSTQVLLDRGIVSPEKLLEAREEQKKSGGRLAEILVATGATTDDDVADALATASGRPRITGDELPQRLGDASLCRRVPRTYLLGRRALPMSIEGDVLHVAVADPFDKAGVEELTQKLGAKRAEVSVAAQGELTEVTELTYRTLGINEAGARDTAPFVLLIMQDDKDVSRLGARLAEEGFHVEHAGDVITANRLLKARAPSAFLITLETPEAETFVLSLRGLEHHEDTPLFVIGEVDDDDDDTVDHLLDIGATDFFERPLRPGPAVAKVRRALAKLGLSPTKPAATPVRAPPPPTGEAPGDTPTKARPLASAPPPSAEEWSRTATARRVHELGALPARDGAAPQQVAQPTGVMGTLRQMAVPEIVQSLEMGRKTARVELVPTDGERGTIGVNEGRVVYAECGGIAGEAAFYELARHTEGFFRIRYGDVSADTNIDGSTTFLLLEAMRRLDEGDGSTA